MMEYGLSNAAPPPQSAVRTPPTRTVGDWLQTTVADASQRMSQIFKSLRWTKAGATARPTNHPMVETDLRDAASTALTRLEAVESLPSSSLSTAPDSPESTASLPSQAIAPQTDELQRDQPQTDELQAIEAPARSGQIPQAISHQVIDAVTVSPAENTRSAETQIAANTTVQATTAKAEENANTGQAGTAKGEILKPDFNFLRGVMGPYLETIASNNDQTISGYENIPKNQTFVLSISHSLNTREVATIIKRVSDHLYEIGEGDKLPRMLVDSNLMSGPFRSLFGGKLGCVVADPESFSRLHDEGESIGVCPEGQRGALTRKDTISLRGRGLTVMALKYDMPILPTATAGAEPLHKDITDLLGRFKPYVQRPLDFLKDFIYERFAVPIVPGAVTPSGPFPLYVLPPGQAFADKIHTEIGAPICPKTIVAEYNNAHDTSLEAKQVGNIYESQVKHLLSKCYRQLRSSGEYHNDDTERFRDVLMQVAQAKSQPEFNALVKQLPTPLLDAAPVRAKGNRSTCTANSNAPYKNLAEQLAHALCAPEKPEVFQSFQIVEIINGHLTEDMNALLHTGHDIVTEQKKKPEDAKRRLGNNFINLVSSAHLWWLSYKFHTAIMPSLYANSLQALYGARVLYELGRDAYTVLTHGANKETQPQASRDAAAASAQI